MGENQQINFIKIAKEINNSKADALVIVTSAIDAGTLAQQIKKYNESIKLYGAMWTRTNDLIQNGGIAVEGMIIQSTYVSKVKTKYNTEFSKKYIDLFQNNPAFVSKLTYDSFSVLAKAIKESKNHEAQNIKKIILKIGSFEALEGDIKINKFGDASRPYSIVTIKDGKYEVLNND